MFHKLAELASWSLKHFTYQLSVPLRGVTGVPLYQCTSVPQTIAPIHQCTVPTFVSKIIGFHSNIAMKTIVFVIKIGYGYDSVQGTVRYGGYGTGGTVRYGTVRI